MERDNDYVRYQQERSRRPATSGAAGQQADDLSPEKLGDGSIAELRAFNQLLNPRPQGIVGRDAQAVRHLFTDLSTDESPPAVGIDSRAEPAIDVFGPRQPHARDGGQPTDRVIFARDGGIQKHRRQEDKGSVFSHLNV